MAKPKKTLTLEQTARRFGISESTLRTLIENGEFIRPRYMGKHPYYTSADLKAWDIVQARTATGPLGPPKKGEVPEK